MNILRHLYLSTACRAPDEPVLEAEIAETPITEVASEPVAEVQPEPEPEVVEPPAPEPIKPEQHGNSGKSPWFQRTIAELRQEKREEKTAREAAEQRAADLQAILERMQGGEKSEPAKTAAAPTKNVDFQTAVRAQVAHDRLVEESSSVRDAGLSEFKDFGASLEILGPERGIGLTTDEFVAELLAVDKDGAHKILDKLAKDPEKAASMVNMDSRRRIVELTRMADGLKTEPKPVVAEVPKAPAISKAPAPKPAISPLSAAPEVDPTSPEGNEKMSDAQWEKWYKNKYQKRA